MMSDYISQWRKQQHVGKDIWRKAGAMGLLCTDISADYAGAGGDFRHEVVLYEELVRRGLSGFGQGVHSICAHYLALAETIRYVKDRKAFGKSSAEFQNTKFKLAEIASKMRIARVFADSRVQRIYGGTNEIMKEVISRSL